MTARAILAKLRHGQEPDGDDLAWVARSLADGTLDDAQTGALAMGLCLNGLSAEGRVALTLAMRDSGQVLSWDVDAPVLDKHSTGGVGDCVSLILAPALAACGAVVPMISGRGLGHTGGTLDKLEAIPGVATDLSEEAFRGVVKAAGCAIVGATADIAPADRRLYAVRDVTSTVDSLDLITASILAKKLAAGLDGLVLDVKLGSGAFMKDIDAARALASALCQTANAAGCRTSALITDMSQPPVPSLGNALEVVEVMHVLTGGAGGPVLELAAALGGALLADAGLAEGAADGAARLRAVVRSGEAAARFARMIAAMGGPSDFDKSWSGVLPEAPVIRAVPAPDSGFVTAIDGQALGFGVVALGGGRSRASDRVDPAVGLSEVLRLGAPVTRGTPLAMIHAARDADADRLAEVVLAAIEIGAAAPPAPDLIIERITG